MLYLVAAGTGFRANALANLTPADFGLTAVPVVTLAGAVDKLPNLVPDAIAMGLPLRLTGTDGGKAQCRVQ